MGSKLVVLLCRLPKDVVLQGKTTWQARQPKASTVARYTAALKRAGAKFRAGIARSAGTGRDTPRTLGTPSSQLTAQRLGRTEQPGSAPGLRSAVREPEPGSSSDAIQGIVTGSRMLDTTSVLGGTLILASYSGGSSLIMRIVLALTDDATHQGKHSECAGPCPSSQLNERSGVGQ